MHLHIVHLSVIDLGEHCEDRGRVYEDSCANQCPRSCADLWDHVQCLQGTCHPGISVSLTSAVTHTHEAGSLSVFVCRRLPLSGRPAPAGRRVCAAGRVSLWASAGERDAGDPARRERHRQLQHLVRATHLFVIRVTHNTNTHKRLTFIIVISFLLVLTSVILL